MKNKRGIITISDSHYRDIDISHKYLQAVFKDFIPIRVDNDWNGRIYHGYHPLFDEITETQPVPYYTVTVTESRNFVGDIEYLISFDRV